MSRIVSSPSHDRLHAPKTCSQSPPEEGAGANMHLEEQLTHAKLIELQQIFEDADEDGGGGLDMDEFRHAMRKAMGDHLTDHDLDQIFMKVDTNCDGTVDWDEYLTYMLLEFQEKDTMTFMNQDKFVARQPKLISSQHKDSIIRIIFLPNITKEQVGAHGHVVKLDHRNGKFLTVGKDGILCQWSPDMYMLSTFKVESQHPKQNVWVTDVCYMAYAHVLVFSTTNRDILFYDVNVGKFCLMSKITELEMCATCMDYYSKSQSSSCSTTLVWGDSRGGVGVILFDGCPQFSVFHINSAKDHRTRVSFAELELGKIRGVKVRYFPNIHDNMVKQIRYYHDLDCFISCCKSSETSMYMGNVRGNSKEASYFPVAKGINCFDYSSQLNVIVTGSYDAIVRVWNPYVPLKPIILLSDHKSPVEFVTINAERELIVSLSEAREIMVHEMATQRCMQTIFRKMVPIGPRPISAVCFNHARQSLLVASNKIAFFRHDHKAISDDSVVPQSHELPVSVILYNPLFNKLISGGEDSLVCVWDVLTGERVMQFGAHKVRENGEEVSKEITAMTFDPTNRRLLTAGRDNLIKIWNFNNGACLREIDISHHGEVTSLICQKRKIIVAGWGRFLEMYVDDPDDDTVERFAKVHTEDILTIAYSPPYLVASADYDGRVHLWSMETRRLLCVLCATSGLRSLTQVKVVPHTILSGRKRGGRKRRGGRRPTIAKKSSIPGKPNEVCQPPVKRPESATPADPMKFNETSVDKLLFLLNRDAAKETVTLFAAGADGLVRGWSTHPEGGLLGQFVTCYKKQVHILDMTTDQKNEYLITADEFGYIRVWDISDYLLKGVTRIPVSKKLKMPKYKRFTYFQQRAQLSYHQNKEVCIMPVAPAPPTRKTSVRAPPLLTSFRGHLCSITSIQYVDSSQLIVSASTDCSIRLWTIYGNHIGIFGQKEPWTIPSNATQTILNAFGRMMRGGGNTGFTLPNDVRRVASAATLRVLKKGVARGWKLARDVMRWLATFQGLGRDEPCDAPSPDLEAESDTSVENKEVLGKWYKPFMKHHPLPELAAPRHFNTKVSVFSSLPLYELKPLAKVEPPPTILDIQARQHLMATNLGPGRDAGHGRGKGPRFVHIVHSRRAIKRFKELRDRKSSHSMVGQSSVTVAGDASDKADSSLIRDLPRITHNRPPSDDEEKEESCGEVCRGRSCSATKVKNANKSAVMATIAEM